MTRRASGDLTAVRAFIVATLSLALAGVAHVSAGGLLPDAGVLVMTLVLATACCAAILTRRTSGVRLAVLLVGAQTTIHFTMTAFAGHGGHEATATTAVGAWTDAVHHVGADLVSDAPMVLAHLVAATATGLLLGRAESALWAVLALLTRAAAFVGLVLRALPTLLVQPGRPASTQLSADLLPRRTALVVVATHVRRGPPALLTAA